ncbi:MAG: queuosine salvage family protein [Candidatus Baldrarchaeia archaeon]
MHNDKHTRIRINYEKCNALAHLLSKFRNFKPDNFEDPKLYPPPSAPPKDVANYFFFIVAIDHRTHPPGSVFLGEIDGEVYRGSLLLYRLAKLKWDEDPQFFSPERMSSIDEKEVTEWLSVSKPKPATVKDPKLRASLLRDAGIKLLRFYDGDTMKIFERAEGSVWKIVENLHIFTAYEDPVAKKAFLLIKFLERRGLWKIKDPQNLRVPVDNHLTRIAIRFGILEIKDEKLKRVLRERIPVSRDIDIELRMQAREAYAIISETSGIKATILDDILWYIGRNCCSYRETPRCDSCERKACELTAKLNIKCKGHCPLAESCSAAQEKELRQLYEQQFETWYY